MLTIMDALLDFFANVNAVRAAGWLLALNVALFGLCLAGGGAFAWAFRGRPVTPSPPAVERRELALAATCVVLNTLVSFAGWRLWRAGIIALRTAGAAWIALDAVALFIIMDIGMYLLHRVAHARAIYPLAHATHHRYDRPRPLTLFVLNPIEVLGFGALWLAVLYLYAPTWPGAVIYLVINAAFGTLGHLGVEPLPGAWARAPLIRHLGTSTFHADHHQDPQHNFGFYTDVWDRLFATRKVDHETRSLL